MKYVSFNQLEDFEFHDTVLQLVSYQNMTLVVKAKYLNIHKYTKSNPNDYDKEIKMATITFDHFQVHLLEPLRAYQTDENGQLYTNDAKIVYQANDAMNIFIQELTSSISLNDLSIQKKNEKTIIELETNGKALLTAISSCVNVKIEWDEYCGRAWYEKYKKYQHEMILITPNSQQKTTIIVSCTLDDKGDTKQVSTYLRYQNKDYFGAGAEWIDAIAHLQKQLPTNIQLESIDKC